MTDPHAAACRRLWASVLLATLSGYNAEHAKAVRMNQGADVVLTGARTYLNSRDGREVMALAWIEGGVDAMIAVIALPRAQFRARLIAPGRMEEAA